MRPRQRQILELIAEAIRVKGYAPSVRELAAAAGISATAAIKHLRRLDTAGVIAREVATWRGIQITERGLRELRAQREQL